jgi:predicted Zn finger-like uncharacterized protein
MSLVTRCTACGTLFKVVADQLKISDGWVRCGQCATVFDAQANLVTSPTVSAPSPTPQQPPAPTPTLSAPEPQAAAPATEPASLSSLLPPPPEAVASSPQPAMMGSLKADLRAAPQRPAALDSLLDSGADSKLPSQLESASFRPGALRDTGELDSETGPSTASWVASDYAPSRDPLAEAESVSVSAEPTTLNTPTSHLPSSASSSVPLSTFPEDLLSTHTAPGAAPSFVTQAQRAARWRSPWVRLALSLVALSLLAVLALQIAVHEKDRLAALRPDAKPWLDQLCEHMGCQVQALKRIESIAVDASSFNRINKNNPQLEALTQSYKLSVTLKNTGTLPVALPHVELSLQDAQDRPILRRVLSPADLGASLAALPPSQDLAGSLTLQIDTAQLAGQRIAGYRVLAFYP